MKRKTKIARDNNLNKVIDMNNAIARRFTKMAVAQPDLLAKLMLKILEVQTIALDVAEAATNQRKHPNGFYIEEAASKVISRKPIRARLAGLIVGSGTVAEILSLVEEIMKKGKGLTPGAEELN